MNRLASQRKKTVVLAASIACFQAPALMLMDHYRGRTVEHVIAACWFVFMAAMLAYVMTNMVKLKRMQRGAGQ